MIDKEYCMSSFLMLRTIYDKGKEFKQNVKTKFFDENLDRKPVKNSAELEVVLRNETEKAFKNGKTAIALSGGIDSAILAKFCPKGTVAYTFKCVVPGVDVIDESKVAARYAQECGLEHKIIEIYWEDFERYAPILMKNKGSPIHSIEVQIYKSSMIAKQQGFDTFLFGESSDVNFGGMDGLLSRDWSVPEFIDRYSYILPYKVLKNPLILTEPFSKFEMENGYVDVHEFNRHVFYCEALGTYTNATETAGINLCAPFSKSYLSVPLDYNRIRQGEGKYLVREIFEKLYPNFEIPQKIPMPRPMNEWLKTWNGPIRPEFWQHCVNGLTGDQKWLVWVLEKFLDMLDNENNDSL